LKPAPLEPLPTRVGWAGFGDYAHFGKQLYRDFLGQGTSFLGLAVFSITGRLLPPDDVALVDDLAVCMHCPEPRVWPAKLARLAASGGRFSAGVAAGWSALDSAIGVQIGQDAATMLVELDAATASSSDRDHAIASFVRSRAALPGFGVHGRRVDERVVALRQAIERRGRQGGRFWRLAEDLWPVAHREKNLDPSFWAAVAGALLDLGLPPPAMPPILSLLFQPSYLAHAVEGADRAEPTLLELPADRVAYLGPAPRQSGRQKAAGGDG